MDKSHGINDKLNEEKSRFFNKINIIVFLIIILVSITYQLFSFVVEPNPYELDALEWGLLLSYGTCGVAAIIVSKRYNWFSHIFGKTYLALGVGYLLLVIGEIVWYYYESTDQDPWPSMADIFYFGFYPLAIFHLVRNCHYFKPKFSILEKSFLIIVSLIIIGTYSYISINEIHEVGFDYYYGMIPVSFSAVALSFAILGAKILRGSDLGTAWLLLAIGLCLTTFTDVWYIILELVESFDTTHPTNTLWVCANLLVAYALVKHYKSM